MGAQDYGRFTRELSPDELVGCFFFTDDDRDQIATRRGDASRLGFAVQLGTVRSLGRFLENPADVPASVLGWTVREIGVAAGTILAATATVRFAGSTRPRSAAPTATARSATRASRTSWRCGCAPGRRSAPRATASCSCGRLSI
jgi:hypothetical protein